MQEPQEEVQVSTQAHFRRWRQLATQSQRAQILKRRSARKYILAVYSTDSKKKGKEGTFL